MINNSLDKKRGGIDKSLKVIEAKLKDILECDFDKDTMIKCTKNLSVRILRCDCVVNV